MGKSFAPEGYSSVSPFLVVRGAGELLDKVKQVFDGEENQRQENEDGTVRHGEVRIGDTLIMIGEATMNEPMKTMLYVYVEDADATYKHAIGSGFTSLEEPNDTPYGDRRAGAEDANGNQWYVATRKG